jgi:phosphate transport system permease protein
MTPEAGVHDLLDSPTGFLPNGNGSAAPLPVRSDRTLSHAVLSGDATHAAPLAPPRRTRDFGAQAVALLAGSALSSFAVVWVLFYQLTLLSGAFGFLICWYACFLAVFWVVTNQVVDRSAATDRVVTTLVGTCAAVVVGALLYIVIWVVLKGVAHFSFGFLSRTMKDYQPALGTKLFGQVGVGQAIVGTLEEVGLAAVMAVPIAFLTAIFLNEVGGWGTRFVRTIVTAMSGVPSVVAGVFIYAIFIESHIFGYSGFAAAIALFVLMLPSITRTTEEVLRVVPGGLREASLALGASEWRTVRQVVLPTARSGLVTAVILGVAIAAGETAPLIFTAFGANTMNADPFHGPQGALPLVLYENIFAAQAVVVQLAFTAAFVLLALVLILFVLARLLGRRSTRKGRVRGLIMVPVHWAKSLVGQ